MNGLKRISIKGFKSIKQMDMELKGLNVLIGANGAGKSNFISFFDLIANILNENLQVYVAKSGGNDFLLYLGQKTTDELSAELAFGKNKYDFALTPTLSNTLVFSREICYYKSPVRKELNEKPLGKGHGETQLHKFDDNQGVISHVIKAILQWRVYHFDDTGNSAKVKQVCNVDDNSMLRSDASNLAAMLYLFRNKNRLYYQNIVDSIKMAFPLFDDFDLRTTPGNNLTIQLEWRQKGTSNYFNAHSLSDGTLRFICLATLLLQPNLPSIILLDEPELGLHPYAITLLSDLLKAAAVKTQVIVSTQSVTLINRLEPEDIVVVENAQGATEFKRLIKKDMKHWLDEYSLGDLWEKNLIGGRP